MNTNFKTMILKHNVANLVCGKKSEHILDFGTIKKQLLYDDLLMMNHGT